MVVLVLCLEKVVGVSKENAKTLVRKRNGSWKFVGD